MIRFGPSGLGGKDDAIKNLETYSQLGLDACEISFTYGVYLDEKSSEIVGEKANELDIKISIHAPYYINLNSKDPKKIEMSKKRILDCCKIGHNISANKNKTPIVFHAGFYSKMSPEETFKNIKREIKSLLEEIKNNDWNVILCPEIMGKKNVFGSIEEISRLVEETGCSFCIDFAHVLARYNSNKFAFIKENFDKFKEWHCHFSGIEYGDKGEKNHKQTNKSDWNKLIEFLISLNKNVTIVSEAPNPVEDSVVAVNIFNILSKD